MLCPRNRPQWQPISAYTVYNCISCGTVEPQIKVSPEQSVRSSRLRPSQKMRYFYFRVPQPFTVALESEGPHCSCDARHHLGGIQRGGVVRPNYVIDHHIVGRQVEEWNLSGRSSDIFRYNPIPRTTLDVQQVYGFQSAKFTSISDLKSVFWLGTHKIGILCANLRRRYGAEENDIARISTQKR